jgi:hypothetical protein
MKQYLILSALGACTVVGHAANAPSPQQSISPTPVSSPQAALARSPSPSAKLDAGTRHLSDAERAELRRQLQEFNSEQHGKRQ